MWCECDAPVFTGRGVDEIMAEEQEKVVYLIVLWRISNNESQKW